MALHAGKSLFSSLIVVLQFALIGFLVWYTGIPRMSPVWLLVIAGGGLGLWAMVALRFHFNIRPEPRTDGRLVTAGPYAVIRHPMYTAVLIATLSLVFYRLESTTVIVWLLLLVALLTKLGHEERRLTARYPEYRVYAERTKRLIPGVY